MFLLIPNRIREIKEEGRREGFEKGRKEGIEEGLREGFEEGRKRLLERRQAMAAETNVERIKRLIGLYDRGRITLDEFNTLVQSRSNGNRKSN